MSFLVGGYVVKKTFVLDTNVLLYDPQAIKNFGHNEVVITLAVLEELDNMKRLHNDLGRNARSVIRTFDALRVQGGGKLHHGVLHENGGKIEILLNPNIELEKSFPLQINIIKNQVILAAYALHKKKKDVIFVSKDFASRVKAEALGIETQDYESLKGSFKDIHHPIREFNVEKKTIDLFLTHGSIKLENEKLCENEYCILNSSDQTQMLGKYNSKRDEIVNLMQLPEDLWGLRPRNLPQRCALDLLMRDEIKLVSLVGQAGSGKTLLALAVALRKVFDEAKYAKILVSRPIVSLGKDIGYLPGTKEDKLYHWMQPIYDNLEFLCHSVNDEDAQESLKWVTESKKLEMEAVTYIRGRSLPNMFMIIDEAQNLTPHEVKTIISRAGQGTKVVLTGDPTQIDNPYLDEDSNGLTYVVSKFNDHKLFGHMLLDITERSELASLAIEVM